MAVPLGAECSAWGCSLSETDRSPSLLLAESWSVSSLAWKDNKSDDN